MRKIKIFAADVLLILSLTALCGCLSSFSADKNPFSVFDGDFSAEISAEINGTNLDIVCKRRGGATEITLVSPSNVSGYVFLTDADKTTLKFGDVEVEARGRTSFLPDLIAQLFSAQGEQVTEIKAEKTDVGVFTVVTTPGAVYRFDGGGSPSHIEGIINGAEVKITFKGFSSVTSSEGQKAV